MERGLAAQIRYYEVRRTRARRRPELHRATLSSLEAHLALAGRATTAAEFSAALSHGGHETALARAEQLDRFANAWARDHALGDAPGAIAAIAGLLAFAAEGDAAFYGAYAAVAGATAAAAMSTTIGEQASRLVEAAIDLGCDPDPVRGQDHLARARVAWRMLRAVAPGFGLAWLTAPPLRHRLPFTERAWSALRELLAIALDHPADLDGTPPPALPPAPPLPPVDAIAAVTLDGWSPALDTDPGRLEARVHALEVGDEQLAARGPAIAHVVIRRDLARDSDEPALVRIAEDVIGRLAGCTTTTELAAWLAWHDAIESVERRWWHLLVQVALWPAVAALVDPAQARPAAVIAARLLGVDPRVALRAPAIERAVTRQLFGAGQTFDDTLSIVGPGAPMVAVARKAFGDHAVRVMEDAGNRDEEIPDFHVAARRFASTDALLGHVDAVLDAATAPRGGDGAVVSWGVTTPLEGLDPELAAIVRPRPEGLW